MSEIRTRWNSLRRRRQLKTGLRRLQRWKKFLLPLLPAMRLSLQESPSQPMELLRLLQLPENLPLSETGMVWALETTEDLVLILQALEKTMEREIRQLG